MSQSFDQKGYLETRLTLLPTAEGGRQTPVKTGYMPNFWLPGSPDRQLASGAIELLDQDELGPGSSAISRIYPFAPEIWGAVAIGAELEVTEGPRRIVGKAVVTKIVPASMPVGS